MAATRNRPSDTGAPCHARTLHTRTTRPVCCTRPAGHTGVHYDPTANYVWTNPK